MDLQEVKDWGDRLRKEGIDTWKLPNLATAYKIYKALLKNEGKPYWEGFKNVEKEVRNSEVTVRKYLKIMEDIGMIKRKPFLQVIVRV